MKSNTCSRLTMYSVPLLVFAVLPLPALAEQPVDLGSAAQFAVLASSTVTNVNEAGTIVTGDIGVSPGTSVTGFPPGVVNGAIFAGGPIAEQAKLDLTVAYNNAAGRDTAPAAIAGNLGGMTLGPGLYRSTSSLAISSGDLTLDAQGDCSAVFIFQMASTLTVTSDRKVVLIGNAQADNIYWQVGTSATLGTTSIFKGNIMAADSITLEAGASLDGRALARTAAVTMDNNAVTLPTPPTPSPNDINGDCLINVEDVTALANFVNGLIDSIQGDGDINNDGEIDDLDVQALAEQIVAGT